MTTTFFQSLFLSTVLGVAGSHAGDEALRPTATPGGAPVPAIDRGLLQLAGSRPAGGGAMVAGRSGMRLDYQKIAPGISQAMMGLENYVRASGLEKSLLTLVKMRASQINGCAYCLDMHTKEARAIHESEQKLGSLAHWQTADCFTPRERAALAWTEALTLIAENHVPEELFTETRQHFSEKALADLSLAIISINGWNRLNISFRLDPESCPVE